ncbi:hypothetical protein JCM21714_3750 [Gracilibacillus boraciitolerans JCM 21714]|uniref:Lipoprotein n=1 Tax=Gracilibacillus boraciitolerans JCM 21714 TaxID=1298598 RepID=W4VPA5_9BACI|nr:hypothetical protein [Gracilibacillus boraciitolerans]GAE94579.1 hypothetical protein JCM21714_3750 [Gracilibacillus boraciitolerans JCM 21714]
MKKVLIIACFAFLIACGQGENDIEAEANIVDEEMEAVFYENNMFELSSLEGWSLDQEATAEEDQHIIFSNGTTKVIVAMVSKEQTIEQMKKSVIASFSKKTEIIEEKENYLAIETNRKENIRANVYFYEGSAHQLVFTFMTPEQDVKESNNRINEFIDKLTIL